MSTSRPASHLALVAALVLGAGAQAAAAPKVVAGWPVAAPVGDLLPGPGGGVAIVAGSDLYAYQANGFRVFAKPREPQCGNCDDGPYTPALQPDGTYGPLGVIGDDFWSVSNTGAFVPSCAGAVMADGGCIASGRGNSVKVWALPAASIGTVRWTYTEPDYLLLGDEREVGPKVIAGGEGEVFAVLGRGTTVSTNTPVDFRVLSLDQATGALRWRRDLTDPPTAGFGTGVALAARPGGGVVVKTARSTVALDRAGVVVWTAPAAKGWDVIVDPAGNGAIVLSDGRVLDAATGVTLRRLQGTILSRGASGTIYTAAFVEKRWTLLANGPSGVAWRYAATGPVRGAQELAGGDVVVSAGLGSEEGLLVRLDPRTRAPKGPAKVAVGLSLREFRTGLQAHRQGLRNAGTIVRVSARATPQGFRRLKVELRRPNGTVPRGGRARSLRLPSGTAYQRVFAATGIPPGSYRLIVTVGGPEGRKVTFPVRVLAEPK